MTPDERAIEALAEALDAVPNIVTSGWGYTPDEHLAECRKLAPDIWNAIDRDALRAALTDSQTAALEAALEAWGIYSRGDLDMTFRQAEEDAEKRVLAEVRREVEELTTHEFIDSYEPGTTWLAVDRADVLRLLGDQEVRRPGG